MGNSFADIIIIGGGAAGLMAAVGAAETMAKRGADERVLVLEKMARPARKIMITGKGRCNFTNLKPWNEFSAHIHPKPNFLKPSFYNLSSEKMMEFLTQHGMEAVVERGDRAYPASYLSSDVVDTLVRAAEKAGAEILCDKEVMGVQKISDSLFSIGCADGSSYSCSKLIICTGGLSYPKTGSSGDGYKWAANAGHSIRPLFPSLTAIVPKGYKLQEDNSKELKGHVDRNIPLSETGEAFCGTQLKKINLSIYADGNRLQSEFGDLDFTDGGIEGPIGFKVSRKCVNALINGSKLYALLDMKPAVEEDELRVRIAGLWKEIQQDKRSLDKLYKTKFKVLVGKLLPASLVNIFIKLNPKADHHSLAKTLKQWKFEIVGYVGYERCVVTAGGVSLDELTAKTLESKLVPGLHFAGELLDLDGDTGGYNLQIAFSTGYLAGISAANSVCAEMPEVCTTCRKHAYFGKK